MDRLRIHPRAMDWIEDKGMTRLTVRQTSVMPGGCCSSGAIELIAEPGSPSKPEGYQKVQCATDLVVYFPKPLFARLSAPQLILQNYGFFKSLRIVDSSW